MAGKMAGRGVDFAIALMKNVCLSTVLRAVGRMGLRDMCYVFLCGICLLL